MTFFDNIRLYLDDPSTGRLKMKFICKKCGKEMDEAEHYNYPCSYGGVAKYHLAEFMCDECKSKVREENA